MLQNLTRTKTFRSTAAAVTVGILTQSTNLAATTPVAAQDLYGDRGATTFQLKLRHTFGVKPQDKGSTNLNFGIGHVTDNGTILGAGLGFNLQDLQQGDRTDTYLVNENINGFDVTKEVRQTTTAMDRVAFGLTVGHDGGNDVLNSSSFNAFSGDRTVTLSFSKASLENPLVPGFSLQAGIGDISFNLFDGGNALKLDPQFNLGIGGNSGCNAQTQVGCGGTTIPTTPVVNPNPTPTTDTTTQPPQPETPEVQGDNPTTPPTNTGDPTPTTGIGVGDDDDGGTTEDCGCDPEPPVEPPVVKDDDDNIAVKVAVGLAVACLVGTGVRYAADKVMSFCGFGNRPVAKEPSKPASEARTQLSRQSVKGEVRIYIGDPQDNNLFATGASGGLVDQWHTTMDMQDGTNHGVTLHAETAAQLEQDLAAYKANRGGQKLALQ